MITQEYFDGPNMMSPTPTNTKVEYFFNFRTDGNVDQETSLQKV